ncbi:MAG: lipid-A-disaccharide synthase N-terminal domain-containing protein [Candidatus Pacebacteria bacterium]|nr:lipid-A-disaccharide synthase N-terminal domain-containing protein [Candidatus Paceibacterota bacterium]
MTTTDKVWIGVSIVAQGVFASRFIVQWLHSEKRKRSEIPVVFWYLSLVGGSLLLLYTLVRQEYVLALGQVTGVVVYSRNLVLIHKNRKKNCPPSL